MPTYFEHAEGRAPALENVIPSLERLDNLIGTTNAARISALHNVLPNLKRLEEGISAERAEQLTGLSKFGMDESLDRLEKLVQEQRTEFDALDFVGWQGFGSGRALWGSEEFHSNVLAWLLDPRQNHSLGDRFLNHFLLSAGVPLAGDTGDRSTTEVTREWPNLVDGQQGSLDILIVSEATQALCAIENKVFSSEHSEQLTRYRKALEVSYSTFTRYHVFLTRGGTHPFREEESEHWTPFTYSTVFQIVQQIVEDNSISTNVDICAFLRQYATTLRRNVMPETSVSQLARRIYLEHREAIDQIVDNKPRWVAEAKPWLKKAVEWQREWELDLEDSNTVQFRSTDWNQFEATRAGIGWAPNANALLLFEFKFDDGLPWLQLALSPGEAVVSPLRKKLFEAARQHPNLFSPKSASLDDNWAILHQEDDYILNEADYGVGWDDGATRAKLETWIADFAASKFPEMNKIIVNCLREYEEERQQAT